MILKKTSILILLVGFLSNYYGQTFKTYTTLEETPDKLVTKLSAEKLNSDNFEIFIFLAASQDTINEIGTYNIDEKLYINGKLANSEKLWSSYKKSSDEQSSTVFYKRPSMRIKLDIGELIKDNAHLVKETNNDLKVEFVNKKQNNRIIGTSNIQFDVPGFTEPKSDFCRLLENKCDDEKVEKTLHTMFKLMYPHTEILATLTNDRKRRLKDYEGNPTESSKTYMILFKDKGVIWSLKYDATYFVYDGKIHPTPRVKIYNGLDDPIQVSESCWKALKATLK